MNPTRPTHRSLITGLLWLCCVFALNAQENCLNGIDDDADGLIDLNDTTDCACFLPPVVPSLLPNASLEEFDPTQSGCESRQPGGLPDATNQANCLTGWQRTSLGTTDAWNAFTLPGAAPFWPASLPQPLPSGTGLAGIWVGIRDSDEPRTNGDGSQTFQYREYLAACLVDSQRTVAGREYRLEFQLGFTETVFVEELELEVGSPGPVNIAVYGIADCDQIYYGDFFNCPEQAGADGWELLGTIDVNGNPDSWTPATFSFTAAREYAALALGGSCADDPGGNRERYRNYYFIDDVRLNEPQAFDQPTAGPVAVSGQTVCDDDIELIGTPQQGASYQWYKDGVAINGAIASTYAVPAGADVDGNYQLRIETAQGNCAISEDVVIQRPIVFEQFADSIALCRDTVRIFGRNDLGATYRWSDGSENNFLAVTEPGEYSVTVSNACVQVVERFVVIDTNGINYRLEQSPTPACRGDSVTVSIRTDWYTNFTTFTDLQGGPLGEGNNARNVTLIAGDVDSVIALISDGCQLYFDTLIINLAEPIDFTATIPSLSCERPTGTIILSAVSSPAAEYLWTSPFGDTLAATGPELTVDRAGRYTVEIMDGINCPTVTVFEVPFDDDFAAAVETINEVCGEDGIGTLTLTGGTAPYTVQWFRDGAQEAIRTGGATLNELSSGNYRVEVTDATDCTVSRVFSILPAEPLRLTAEVIFEDCQDPESGLINLLATGGAPPYRFARVGDEFAPRNDFSDLPEGDYRFVVTDRNDCFADTVAVSLSAPVPFDLILPDRITIALGETATLPLGISGQDFGGGTIAWTGPDSLSCVACPNPVVAPKTTSRYEVTFTTGQACSETADIIVEVDRRAPFYAPTAFSPNGDGQNDRWQIFTGAGVAGITGINVFNRWGGLVWDGETSDNAPPLSWDGTVGGEPLRPGVFAYTATLLLVDGRTEIINGSVTLLE